MKLKKAFVISVGDAVVNLGTVSKVEVYQNLTKLDIIGNCISARYFWFESHIELFIVEKKET